MEARWASCWPPLTTPWSRGTTSRASAPKRPSRSSAGRMRASDRTTSREAEAGSSSPTPGTSPSSETRWIGTLSARSFPTPPTVSHTSTISSTLALGADESSDLDGSVLGYHWDFGDGTEGFGVYVYHTFAMPGRYTVTLTVTDNSELTNTSTALFTVRLSTEEPIASFDANVPQPLFPGF